MLAAAGLGNLVASFFRPPYEIVKQRLQAGKDPSAAAAISRILSEDGPLGFWRGLAAQVLAKLWPVSCLEAHCARTLSPAPLPLPPSTTTTITILF